MKFALKFILFTTIYFHSTIQLSADETKQLKSDWVYAGYSSLLPGLGQWKKDRPIAGGIFLTLFLGGVYNWGVQHSKFEQARNNYEKIASYTTIYSLNSNSGSTPYLISSIIRDQAFQPYQIKAAELNGILSLTAFIYIFQIFHAYFAKPGEEFSKPVSLNGLQWNYYQTRSFGEIDSNYQLNYNWRF
ncbi:MAG: hypothetical protein SFU98_10745 [Leptospiraceae bacterium]|nr:hypothetical protein [Leptospiraceae bacterium]